MTTEVLVGRALADDAGIDIVQYVEDAGYTVESRVREKAVWVLTITEDLNDSQKDDLARSIVSDTQLVFTDVKQDTETAGTAKQRYKRVVDRCAELVLRRGFEHPAASGQIYALDISSQVRFHRLFDQRSRLTYPFRILEADNAGGVNMTAAADVVDFFQDMNDAMFAIEDDATTTKQSITTTTPLAAARQIAEDYLIANNCRQLIRRLDGGGTGALLLGR